MRLPIFKLFIRDGVAVAERLDDNATRIGLTLIPDEEPLKIFTAVHLLFSFMITARKGRHST